MSRALTIAAAIAGLYEIEGLPESRRRASEPVEQSAALDDAGVLAIDDTRQADPETLDLLHASDEFVGRRHGFGRWLKQAVRRWLRRVTAPEALHGER